MKKVQISVCLKKHETKNTQKTHEQQARSDTTAPETSLHSEPFRNDDEALPQSLVPPLPFTTQVHLKYTPQHFVVAALQCPSLFLLFLKQVSHEIPMQFIPPPPCTWPQNKYEKTTWSLFSLLLLLCVVAENIQEATSGHLPRFFNSQFVGHVLKILDFFQQCCRGQASKLL